MDDAEVRESVLYSSTVGFHVYGRARSPFGKGSRTHYTLVGIYKTMEEANVVVQRMRREGGWAFVPAAGETMDEAARGDTDNE